MQAGEVIQNPRRRRMDRQPARRVTVWDKAVLRDMGVPVT